ncbi:response regulator transcription factor [Paenibacillus sp. TRM 82003]|nr:response regulator transcription factor [Paenibacillus sp. TRM 82003]
MTPIKILIADDHPIIRDGLRTILELQEDLKVVGTASNGQTAIQMAEAMQPDVILMDLYMPDLNGIEAAKQIRERLAQTHILIITSQPDDEMIIQALIHGASGFLLKDWETDEIVRAIRAVFSGQLLIPSLVSSKLSENLSHSAPHPQTRLDEEEIARQSERFPWDLLDGSFSQRERQIVYLLQRGFSNTEIAVHLHLSIGTVKNYISSIYKTLDVTSRPEAVQIIRSKLDNVSSERRITDSGM